jgi:hypothetical protein
MSAERIGPPRWSGHTNRLERPPGSSGSARAAAAPRARDRTRTRCHRASRRARAFRAVADMCRSGSASRGCALRAREIPSACIWRGRECRCRARRAGAVPAIESGLALRTWAIPSACMSCGRECLQSTAHWCGAVEHMGGERCARARASATSSSPSSRRAGPSPASTVDGGPMRAVRRNRGPSRTPSGRVNRRACHSTSHCASRTAHHRS